MLDWIFEGIVTWISSVVTDLMDAVSGLFLNALGTDMTAMEEYFPFAEKAFTVMQYTGWAILFLVTVWQLFRVFGGPVTEAENPLTLLARSSLFALLIGFAKPIFTVALDIATAPYTALMDVTMTAEDFTFSGFGAKLSAGLTAIVSVVSVVGLLLIIILEIIIGWNYFKLLLETVERYIVVGVICYTSPLAYAMGASKTTSNVFRSWCHLVGSQLLMLVMNVWFLRGFNSSMGQFIASGGVLSNGHGSIFLWLFCALAFLKTAQKFDSYLSSIGVNVAQTGGNMGMELLMAARTVSGIGGSSRSAGSVFRGGSTATGTGAAATGFASGFVNRFKGNSYVRDAVVSGGTRMGMGGTIGFVGRAFGGMAARSGATLNGESISSVASRPPDISGSIAGSIADRSLGNYMPHMAGKMLSNTQISGGHISTTSVSPDGKNASVEMYSASQYDAPTTPHSVVTASDGSQWFQMAAGPGAGAYYSVPDFNGDLSESGQVASTFPDAPEGTILRTADEGVIEASLPGETSMLYNSDTYAQPEGEYSVVTDGDGNTWYQLSADGIEEGSVTPPMYMGNDSISFPEMDDGTSIRAIGDGVVEASSADGNSMLYNSALYAEPEGEHNVVTSEDGCSWYQISGTDLANGAVSAPQYIGTTANGSDGEVSFPEMADGTRFTPSGTGVIAATEDSGNNTLWYNSANYEEPEAPHTVMQSSNGVEWYAMQPHASTPDFENGDAASGYNQAQFHSFMPGYEQSISSVDGSNRQNGYFEVRNKDGSGTRFYDTSQYAAPRGNYQVFEDTNGSQWYAIQGESAIERKPVYDLDGKPVYENENAVKTKTVETVRYKNTPSKFSEPKKREKTEIKPPKRRR